MCGFAQASLPIVFSMKPTSVRRMREEVNDRDRRENLEARLMAKRKVLNLVHAFTEILNKSEQIQASSQVYGDVSLKYVHPSQHQAGPAMQMAPFKPHIDESQLTKAPQAALEEGQGLSSEPSQIDIISQVLGHLLPERSVPVVVNQVEPSRNQVLRREVCLLSQQQVPQRSISEATHLSPGAVAYTSRLASRDGMERASAIGTWPRGRPSRLTDNHATFVRQLIDYHEGELTLQTIKNCLVASFPGLRGLSLTAVRSFVRRRLKYSKTVSRNRNTRFFCARQRANQLQRYLTRISQHVAEGSPIWSLDEASVWVGRRARKRWSPTGTRRMVVSEAREQPRFSLLLAICGDGRYSFRLYDSSVTTAIFAAFLSSLNSSTSLSENVILMDNVRFHHSKLPQGLLRSCGAIPVFTPAYYPDSNPVETVFSVIKRGILDYTVASGAELAIVIQDLIQLMTVKSLEQIFTNCWRVCLEDYNELTLTSF